MGILDRLLMKERITPEIKGSIRSNNPAGIHPAEYHFSSFISALIYYY